MLTTETFRKAARDPAEFGSYYLAHYFTRRSPPFHRQLSALWRRRVMKNRDPVSDCAAMLTEKGTRSAIAAPRGHAKSTVMSLQNVLHAALFGYKRYILLVSDTEAQAVSFLDAIKNELETNERILADFGEQPGKTWKTGSILLSNGCRIDAVGSGQISSSATTSKTTRASARRSSGRRPPTGSGRRSASPATATRTSSLSAPSCTTIPFWRACWKTPASRAGNTGPFCPTPPPPCGRTGSASPRISPTPTGKKPPTPSISSTARKCWQAPKSSGRKNSATTICGSCG